MKNRFAHFAAYGSLCAMAAMLLVSLAFPHRFESQAPYALTTPLSKLNIQGTPASLVMTKAVGAQTNQAYVNIAVRDRSGNLVPSAPITFWLSDATTCAGMTATAASGTADIIGTTGANFAALTAKKAFLLQSSATGQIQFGVLDSSKTHFVPCAYNAFSGVTAGTALATGDYK